MQQIIPNKIAMQMAWAENISGEEEEMELNKPDSTDECDVVPLVDAWRIEAADCGGEAE